MALFPRRAWAVLGFHWCASLRCHTLSWPPPAWTPELQSTPRGPPTFVARVWLLAWTRSPPDEFIFVTRGGRDQEVQHGVLFSSIGSQTAVVDRKSTRLNSSHSQISYA